VASSAQVEGPRQAAAELCQVAPLTRLNILSPQSEKDSQELVQHLVRKHFMPSPADAAVSSRIRFFIER
jgi:hypothetical protein